MDAPTPDTPVEREKKAADLAADLRRFKLELRFYMFMAIVLLAVSILQES